MAKAARASPDPATPKAKKVKKRRAYSGAKPRRKRSLDKPDPAAGSSAVADDQRPHGPKPAGAKVWTEPTFQTTTTCSGGYGGGGRNDSFPAVSTTRFTDRGEERFFHVERNKPWVFKAVGGPKAIKGSLRRVKIMRQLLDLVANDTATDNAPDAGDSQRDSPDKNKKDKVDELDTIEDDAGPPPKKPKAKKPKNVVLSLEMPRLCPLSEAGAASQEKVMVRVLKKHAQQLWVSENSILWLFQYMATEHALGSVDEKPRTPGGKKPPTPDEDGEGEDSDSDDESVPKIKWDYEGSDGYYVEVDGSPKVRCRISGFTQAKWDKVSNIYNYQTTVTSASKDEISQACYDTLLEYVKSTR